MQYSGGYINLLYIYSTTYDNIVLTTIREM